MATEDSIIGTNDLIQYTLAVDRVNENVASLYDPLNLSILRLIKSVVDAVHNAGKWVGMCGEMAADPVSAVVLLGLGLDEFSMSSAAVPAVKRAIRSTSLADAKAVAKAAMALSSSAEVAAYLKSRLA